MRRSIRPPIQPSDTVAIGWIRGADLLEITAQDPRHGTIFYSIGQTPSATPQFNRQEQCVSCHLTWDTLGVPGLTVKSTFPRKEPGEFLNGGAVDHRRPMAERWSGWFVTGAKVPAEHMGNRPLSQPTPLAGPAPRLSSVEGQFDTTAYLRTTSDIRAEAARAPDAGVQPDHVGRLGSAPRRFGPDAGGGRGAGGLPVVVLYFSSSMASS